ncbi:MAG: hypothetical protein WCJ70_01655 [bacterium]
MMDKINDSKIALLITYDFFVLLFLLAVNPFYRFTSSAYELWMYPVFVGLCGLFGYMSLRIYQYFAHHRSIDDLPIKLPMTSAEYKEYWGQGEKKNDPPETK